MKRDYFTFTKAAVSNAHTNDVQLWTESIPFSNYIRVVLIKFLYANKYVSVNSYLIIYIVLKIK